MISTLIAMSVMGIGAWLYTPDKSVDELHARYLRSPTDFVDVAGLRLHIRDDKSEVSSDAVILLHGFGASLHTWEPWAQELQKSMRVIRIDLPGFALTGPDPSGKYDDTRSLEIVLALINKLGIEKASLVGNSIGGRIAWKFAAAYPDRINKLVLIAPDGFASPGFEYDKAPEFPASIKLMRYAFPAFAVRMSLTPAYGDPLFMSDELLARYRDLMLAPNIRQAMIDRMEQSILIRPQALLQSIKVPTLLMWGQKDQMIPIANSSDYLQAMPHATLVTFPDLGHLPFEESPLQTVQPVLRFLK